ncbi:FadR/GntR family transcriptional regulator [Croceibacterium salegens]|nr:GntR family transcriptional regulator [Croceibacterium salegens]
MNAKVEQIYRDSAREETERLGLPEILARRIEDDIVRRRLCRGGVVGSLRDLSERYHAGRASVREAVGLLERRGLGRLRPGPCGGFIVATPSAGVVASELACYLRLAGTAPHQLMDARVLVDSTAAEIFAEIKSGGSEYSREGGPVISLFARCLDELTIELLEKLSPGHTVEGDGLRRVLEVSPSERLARDVTAFHLRLGELLNQLPARVPPLKQETSPRNQYRTLATLVASKLAVEIQSNLTAGQKLGSEWDLCDRFSVSRTTLRQAIRQLQDSGLVESRRGRGNGLLVRDIRVTGSVRLVLAYLIGQQMDPRAAGTLLFRINRHIPALAVHRATPKQRRELGELLATASLSDPMERIDLLRLVQRVSQLADSPLIDLFSRCLAAYEARFHPALAERLPVRFQADYFDMVRLLLDHAQTDGAFDLEWAKVRSEQVMLAMAVQRPI